MLQFDNQTEHNWTSYL